MGYRGFNNGNYIKQYYDTNQNPGTGDFHIMYWVKITSPATNQCIFHRGDGDADGWGSGPIIQIEHTSSARFQVAGNAAFGNLSAVDLSESLFPNNEWKHVCFQRSRGYLQVFIDGDLAGATVSTQNLDNNTANVWIGNRPYNNRPFINGQLALFRYATTAFPTTSGTDWGYNYYSQSDEIRRIYNDEKKFFAENAKCTLYGTSDQVEAIGVDTIKDVASFGTSAGRSDFSGLSRINNTTTAVTTAISASDGLIAEQ